MNLHKSLMTCALMVIFSMGGVSCTSWFGVSPDDEQAAKAMPVQEDTNTDTVKVAPTSQNAVQAGLDKVAHKLVKMAADNVTPKKSRMHMVKKGKEYVASYAEVDQKSMTTSMQQAKKGQYVGFIRYAERHYECRAKTKAEALKARDCTVVKNRYMNEMVRYDGKKWNY